MIDLNRRRKIWLAFISLLIGAVTVYLTFLGVGLLYIVRRILIALWLKLPMLNYRVYVERNLTLLTRDNLTLTADHYYPVSNDPFPTILIRSPYGRSSRFGFFGWFLEFIAFRFAERGYHVLVQDVRGRFQSEGEFIPFFHEEDDGLDTIAWLKTQTWFNGVLGTWGPSYLGLTQWVIGDDAPEIQAMMPSVTASTLYPIVYPDNAFDLGLVLRWITIFHILDHLPNQPWSEAKKWLQGLDRYLKPAYENLPIQHADQIATGETVAFFQEWASHEEQDDPIWQAVDNNVQFEKITAPIHLTGGWYDFFLRGLLSDYQRLKHLGQQPYLTIGPWHHFHADYMLDSMRDGLSWFDTHLKGKKGLLRAQPVRIYVMGADEWRDLPTFPPTTQTTLYYLQANRRLSLEEPPAASPPDSYCYDPHDPTPVLGGAMFGVSAGAKNNQKQEKRADILLYTTEPLHHTLEIIGYVKLILYARSSLPYTDFYGRVCDVYPDGRSINICDGLFRVTPEKITPLPDGSWRLELDLWATAHRFMVGHRIRLQVASGAHPRWNRNSGTGKPAYQNTELLRADQTIFHDEQHPSALVLPVYQQL